MAIAKIQTLERARTQNHLWPTVADALDTYLRRRARDADGYEMVWRLIHVWEAIGITLAAASLTRIRSLYPDSPHFQRMKELCYGQLWDESNNTFKSIQGAFDGSIDRWLDILFYVANRDLDGSAFLGIVRQFLNGASLRMASFNEACRRGCDMPPCEPETAVKDALRVVNSFRNRFAHVPFPHDVIERIATHLEELTCQLLDVQLESGDKPIRSWQAGGVLAGAVTQDHTFLQGSLPKSVETSREGTQFAYSDGAKNIETWRAEPFVLIDSMERPYVLTRLKNRDSGSWEFTRFKAEADAVIPHDEADWLVQIPQPTELDYPSSVPLPQVVKVTASPERSSSKAPQEAPDEVTNYSQALEARRKENFDAAIDFLRDFARDNDTYHPAWLNLGVCLREKALRDHDVDPITATELLKESIDAFGHASKHVDEDFQATALYERSKSEIRLFQFGSEKMLKPAHTHAMRAAVLSPDYKFGTWVEYIERRFAGPLELVEGRPSEA